MPISCAGNLSKIESILSERCYERTLRFQPYPSTDGSICPPTADLPKRVVYSVQYTLVRNKLESIYQTHLRILDFSRWLSRFIQKLEFINDKHPQSDEMASELVRHPEGQVTKSNSPYRDLTLSKEPLTPRLVLI